MRRLGPRPLGLSLRSAVQLARPATLLAAVQSAWPGVAGAVMAAAAEPVREREGTVTFACESAVWAHELELMAPGLVVSLNEALGAQRVEELRFTVGSGPNPSP